MITRFYLSPHSPPTFEVVLTRFVIYIYIYIYIIPQVITRFYLSPHSPPTFEVVLTRFVSLISPYVPLDHQSGSAYGCSFVTYGHPEGSAAGDITIIWNDVFK